jgi:hypothetical protein
MEVVLKPRITAEGKARADSAQSASERLARNFGACNPFGGYRYQTGFKTLLHQESR